MATSMSLSGDLQEKMKRLAGSRRSKLVENLSSARQLSGTQHNEVNDGSIAQEFVARDAVVTQQQVETQLIEPSAQHIVESSPPIIAGPSSSDAPTAEDHQIATDMA